MATANKTLEVLQEHDVAHIIGLPVAFLRPWQRLRQGPKYIKIEAQKSADGMASKYCGGSE